MTTPHTEHLKPEHIFDLKRIQDVQLSPDGRQMAFVVMEQTKEHPYPIAHIWIMETEGGEPRQLTRGPRLDLSPRWSPDGETLAFLSDRAEEGKLQLYLLPMVGGEAISLTDVPGGIPTYRTTPFAWSPDGRHIAFLSPEVDVEEEKRRREEREDHLVAGQELRYVRLWVTKAHPEALDSAQDKRRRRVGDGEAWPVTPPDVSVWTFAWSPGSDAWVLAATDTPEWEGRLMEANRLLYLPLGDGAPNDAQARPEPGRSDGPQELCQMQGLMTCLRWSPDGEWVAFISNERRITSGGRIFTVPATGGEPQPLTPLDYPGGIEWFDRPPGSAELIIVANEDVRVAVGQVPAGGGSVRPLAMGGEGFTVSEMSPGLSWSRDGGRWACVREDGTHPAEVWLGRPDGPWHRVTGFNAWTESLALGEVESVSWTSDGWEIGGLLVKPVDYQAGRAYPLVVQLQGGPGWCWVDRFLADWRECAQHLAARGYAVFLPNPRGSAGRGWDFLEDFIGNPGDVQLRDILSGVEALIDRGIADPEHLGIGGWSWGGYMTAWAITQTDRFKAAALGMAPVNWLSKLGQSDMTRVGDVLLQADLYTQQEVFLAHSPITHVQHVRTPTLILHSAEDRRVPVGQAWELYRGLQRVGVETELVVYPRAGHGPLESRQQLDALERTLAWYDRFLQ